MKFGNHVLVESVSLFSPVTDCECFSWSLLLPRSSARLSYFKVR